MILSDIYIYNKIKDSKLIDEFIQTFLKGFVPMDLLYEYPLYGEPTVFETNNFEDMLDYVLEGSKRSYTFYLKNSISKSDCKFGIIRINSDESICLGVTVKPKLEDFYREKLKSKFKTENIFVCYEVPPPVSIKEIESIMNKV